MTKRGWRVEPRRNIRDSAGCLEGSYKPVDGQGVQFWAVVEWEREPDTTYDWDIKHFRTEAEAIAYKLGLEWRNQ